MIIPPDHGRENTSCTTLVLLRKPSLLPLNSLAWHLWTAPEEVLNGNGLAQLPMYSLQVYSHNLSSLYISSSSSSQLCTLMVQSKLTILIPSESQQAC